MDNSHQFGYMRAPPPSFADHAGLDGAVYPGPPPHPPPPAAGHSWDIYQHPPPATQHQWPRFPHFDPSRPPPGTFEPPQNRENPPPSWTQNQWSNVNINPPNQPQFPNSAPPSYQPNSRLDNSAYVYTSNPQNYSFTNRYTNEPQNSQNKSPSITASDEEAKQRLRDEQWIQRFLRTRNNYNKTTQIKYKPSISEFKEKLYGTVQMLADLNLFRRRLKDNLENEDVWTETLLKATEMKNNLQKRLKDLKEPDYVSSVQRKLQQVRFMMIITRFLVAD